jgi:hypothetical protein
MPPDGVTSTTTCRSSPRRSRQPVRQIAVRVECDVGGDAL